MYDTFLYLNENLINRNRNIFQTNKNEYLIFELFNPSTKRITEFTSNEHDIKVLECLAIL